MQPLTLNITIVSTTKLPSIGAKSASIEGSSIIYNTVNER